MNMMTDNDITRFVTAQDNEWSGYANALEEIRSGRKASHWIWYIFPQLRGLGRSYNANYYGLADRSEAEAYLCHPILGPRLREISTALLRHKDKSAREIFGSIDDQKVKSCMTVFNCLSPNDIFGDVLNQFYDGKKDPHSVV